MTPPRKVSSRNSIGILATGTEITEGDILNTNSREIAHILTQQGLAIGFHMTASDNETDMETALQFLLKHHQAVIITGGLGPTSDDRTRFALSKVTGKELKFDEPTWKNLQVRSRQKYGREAHPSNQQQAFFPEGAQIIPNPNGSAAGCFMTHKRKLIFMLPGPPNECLPMFTEAAIPILLKLKKLKQNNVKLSWNLQGVSEGEIAALIDEAVKAYPVITGYRANNPYVEIKIYTIKHPNYDEMIEIVEKIIAPYKIP